MFRLVLSVDRKILAMDDKLKASNTLKYSNNCDCVVYESIDLLGLDDLKAVMLQIQNESKSQGFCVLSMQTVAHVQSKPNIEHIVSNISYWANRLSECNDSKSKDIADKVKLAIAPVYAKSVDAAACIEKPEVIQLKHFLTSPAHFIEKMSKEGSILYSNNGTKKWRYFRQVPVGWSVVKCIRMTSSGLLGPRDKVMGILDDYDCIIVYRYRKLIGYLLKSDA